MIVGAAVFVIAFSFGVGVNMALGNPPVSRYWRDWHQGYRAARRAGWSRLRSWRAGSEWATLPPEDAMPLQPGPLIVKISIEDGANPAFAKAVVLGAARRSRRRDGGY